MSLQLVQHGAILPLVARQYGDRGTRLSESKRDSAPDSTVAAGHHRDPPAQVEHFGLAISLDALPQNSSAIYFT
jgi:hypothetical protein